MKVLLHIGQSKTGTSAIQAFLTLNRYKLRESGVLYPSVMVNGVAINMGSHNAVADALSGVVRFPGLRAEEYFKQFFDEAESGKSDLLILSAEHFFGGEPRVWDISNPDDYLEHYKKKIRSLAAFLRGHEVSILVYLRPQLDWLASAISQTVRIEGLISDKNIYKSDAQFFEMVRPILDYTMLLDAWRDIIRPVSINAVPYDRQCLHKGSSVSDFLFRIGLDGVDFPYASEDVQVNESLSRDYLEVKKRLNLMARSKHRERAIIRCLEVLSRSSDWGSAYALDPKVEEMVERVVDNSSINSDYMGAAGRLPVKSVSYGRAARCLTESDIDLAAHKFNREFARPVYRILEASYALKSALRNNARPIHALLHQFKMAYWGVKYRR
ncbi:MAG: hypothetical protein AB1421_00285 [Pseudomonadota bacterium]